MKVRCYVLNMVVHTVSAVLCIAPVCMQGYGFAEVEQMYGLDTTRTAAEQLKQLYGGKGQMKLKLFISVKGIKLFDHQSMVRRM